MIIIVRNPIDVIPSFANLSLLKSHSKTTVEKFDKDFPEWWDQWVDSMVNRMAENHEFMMGTVAA